MNFAALEDNDLQESKATVLIVMPEPEELATVSNLLSDMGYVHQEWARNASEAATVLARRSISMVLADYDDTNWIEMLRATLLKTPEPRLTFGFSFSKLISRDSETVLRAGAYNILGRPYRGSEVRQALGFAWQAWVRECGLQAANESPRRRSIWPKNPKRPRVSSVIQHLGHVDHGRSLMSDLR